MFGNLATSIVNNSVESCLLNQIKLNSEIEATVQHQHSTHASNIIRLGSISNLSNPYYIVLNFALSVVSDN